MTGTRFDVSEERLSSSRRAHVLMAFALAAVYLSVMSGHLSSMDGLYMERQAYALAFQHSIRFQTPVWTWRPEPTWNSMYGIGLSLLYVPGMLVSAALRAHVPITTSRPSDLFAFYLRELYDDHLYTVGASWVHAAIVAFAAYLVARLIVELGFSGRAALWGMGLYGLGSSAFVYARGDFAQPLEGLCWVAAFLAAVRYRHSRSPLALVAACAAVAYAILTRPVEGMLLLPAMAVSIVPGVRLPKWRLSVLKPWSALAAAALGGVAVTLLINWARFGNALHSGYDDDNTWVMPTVRRWAGALVSPGRGIIWEFPAVVLIPLGLVALARRGHLRDGVAFLLLAAALLLNTTSWYMWWGGWCWGLRLFTPATPLMAVLAGAGLDQVKASVRNLIGAVLLLLGFMWALPGVIVDLQGGYGELGENVWRVSAYPPIGAWQFVHRLFARASPDTGAVDILWFRLAHDTGYWSLLVPVGLILAAGFLAARSRRLVLGSRPSTP